MCAKLKDGNRTRMEAAVVPPAHNPSNSVVDEISEQNFNMMAKTRGIHDIIGLQSRTYARRSSSRSASNRLSSIFSASTSDLPTPLPERQRRNSAANPQNLERTSNGAYGPWFPPQSQVASQQHKRIDSVQYKRPYNQHLAPLTPPADVHRKPLPRDGSSQSTIPSLESANSSPTIGSRPPSMHSSQPSSPYNTHPNIYPHSALEPQHVSKVQPVPRSAGNASPKAEKAKRKSWFGGNKHFKKDAERQAPTSWILGHGGAQPPYNLDHLIHAQPVPELWNNDGDCFVYLFPRTSGKGPSFRVDSSVFSSSSVLTEMAHGKVYSIPGAGQTTAQLASAQKRHISVDMGRRFVSTASRPSSSSGTPPISYSASNSMSDPSEDSHDPRHLGDGQDGGPIHLYLPIALSAAAATKSANPRAFLTSNDMDTLVSARNLFAFLLGQAIVATERKNTIFSVFLRISELLTSFGFSNLDGSTFGEIAHTSFDMYVEELHLGDVRASREKTIESIILAERMRSVMLYNEAFVHAVGKYDALLEVNPLKFGMILTITRQRLERAHMDLEVRTRNIEQKLVDFNFPAIFAGVMNSKTADEAKTVKFGEWGRSFHDMRNWFMNYYRGRFGAWPPKASSKKNNLETSGLNRLVLLELYRDLSDLYDLIVDRENLTTRTADLVVEDDYDGEDADGPMQRALRKVLNEYDRSTPPVQPPMPFDTPIIPSLTAIGDKKAEAKARTKKLKKDTLNHVLHASYNKEANLATPFLDAFREYEYRRAEGSTISRIADIRQGQWIFLYAVLQSLPMLVVDAPAVKWTQGVEYFLCEPPRSGVPWVKEDPTANRSWYSIAGGAGVVSLPSDAIEHGIEGIYRRSHCWEMAEKWTAHSQIMSNIVAETLEAPLQPPPSFGAMPGAPKSRDSSPGSDSGRSKRKSVMMMGLEALPVPAGINPGGVGGGSPHLRAISAADSSKTFDAILGPPAEPAGKKKGKK
ncbi:hypothetical protein EJ08DRAFT_672390 [Tothia fuscella]|uniref:DUF8004 domain-containing protein n=1 Tax=Tothia fuscella TaxID=1048955 RepID=A0A9P4TVF7_9PEZI|nr:hypothetical protein EJ08DRAFT_672390 [Tothia fuscella]